MAELFVAPEIHVLPPQGHRARNLTFFILAAVPIAFGFLSLWLGQDANWDLRNYHWYNAYAIFANRWDLDLLPSQTPWFYNPAIDLPFYWLATHTAAPIAGFVLGFVQGLNFLLLFMLGYVSLVIPNPRHKVIVCALLAILGLVGGGGLALIGTTFYDNITSLGLFLSALLILRHYDALMLENLGRSMARTALFGLPSGLMMGLKLPAVIFCVGLCLALLFMSGPFHRRFALCFAFGIGVLLGASITLGPWAWFLYKHFGSPLFPYFNNFFHSPLAPSVSARDTQFIPSCAPEGIHCLGEFLFFPFIFGLNPLRVGEIPWQDWRIPFLYALLPTAVILQMCFGRARITHDVVAYPHATRYLLWAATITYIMWLILFCIYRYLVPFEMLTPLLIVLTMGLLPIRVGPRTLLTCFVLIGLAFTIRPGSWYRRATWDEHYVSASIPDLGNTKDLMILMAGFEPYSHLVTQFPRDIPFIRIQSNFTSPDQNKGFNLVIHKRIEAHQGRFMLLIPPWQHELAETALNYFHLALTHQTCQKVVDHLYDDKVLDLCSLELVSTPKLK